MSGRSIFMGLSDLEARRIKQQEGASVSISFRDYGRIVKLEGIILSLKEEPCGTLLMIRNENYMYLATPFGLNGWKGTPLHSHQALPGCEIVPLWISKEGGSGVLDYGNVRNYEVGVQVRTLEGEALALRALQAETTKAAIEAEVNSCMAL